MGIYFGFRLWHHFINFIICLFSLIFSWLQQTMEIVKKSLFTFFNVFDVKYYKFTIINVITLKTRKHS